MGGKRWLEVGNLYLYRPVTRSHVWGGSREITTVPVPVLTGKCQMTILDPV